MSSVSSSRTSTYRGRKPNRSSCSTIVKRSSRSAFERRWLSNDTAAMRWLLSGPSASMACASGRKLLSPPPDRCACTLKAASSCDTRSSLATWSRRAAVASITARYSGHQSGPQEYRPESIATVVVVIVIVVPCALVASKLMRRMRISSLHSSSMYLGVAIRIARQQSMHATMTSETPGILRSRWPARMASVLSRERRSSIEARTQRTWRPKPGAAPWSWSRRAFH